MTFAGGNVECVSVFVHSCIPFISIEATLLHDSCVMESTSCAQGVSL